MKLSTNFVKDYVDIDVDVETLAEDMTRVGNEYDSAEKLIPATKLVIGKVIECKEHPDSDHLHCCKVDIGSEILNIVCGAPNVKEGIKVIVALEGAELPEGIKIKKGMIRGQESNGMICALYEIGLDKKFLSEEDKNGIHILGEDAEIGKDPIEYMGLNDEVIDFELTANRGDLLSIIGMANEIAAIYGKKVRSIDTTHTESGEDLNKSFNVKVNTENCSLFLARKALNVTIKESPKFIKNRLIASGIRPINNVVDISNYVMLECGQPLHFYDSDRLGDTIEVRMAKKDEKLTTLDEIERTLDENDIVISDGKRAIGLAGVMGGLDTEIESTTKNVVIEAAIFDGIKVRKTSKKIVRSEASNRFEKGLDPNRTYIAMERAVKLLEEYADAKIQTGTVIYDKSDKSDKVIEITVKNINDILGADISEKDIIDVYERLGFSVEKNGEKLVVTVPRRRLDINIKEDLIEEVSRIYGVDNIQGKLPTLPVKQGSYDKLSREIRNRMVALGLNEVLSMIFLNEKDGKKFTTDEFETVKLLDPLSEERSAIRYTLIPSLLKIYQYNSARGQKDVNIFEIGKGFWKKGEEYGENKKICALMTGEYYLGINNRKNVDFYIIKGVVEELLDYLGYENRYSFIQDENIPKEFHPGQTAKIVVNNNEVGIIGKLHPQEVKEDVYVFEINLDDLLSIKSGKMKYKEISKYPSIKKDLAMVVENNISSMQIEKEIKKAGGSLLRNIEVFDVYQGEQVGKDKKSIAYSLTFEAQNRTLTDEEINQTLEKIIEKLEKELHAELRK